MHLRVCVAGLIAAEVEVASLTAEATRLHQTHRLAERNGARGAETHTYAQAPPHIGPSAEPG